MTCVLDGIGGGGNAVGLDGSIFTTTYTSDHEAVDIYITAVSFILLCRPSVVRPGVSRYLASIAYVSDEQHSPRRCCDPPCVALSIIDASIGRAVVRGMEQC